MIEVKMPSGASDLRIKHYKSMAIVPEDLMVSAKDKMHFLAEFLGLRYNQVLDFREKDINQMTGLAVRALARMDVVSALPKEIVLKGQTFTLVDPNKIGIGWHIDFQGCDITKDPVRLACLFYVQEGFNYSDVDENNNITFPIASRYELFAEEFPLDLFIRGSNFFLKRSLISIRRSTALKIAQNKSKTRTLLLLKSLNLTNGSNRLKRLWTPSTSRGIKH